jgi:hypothetical protein
MLVSLSITSLVLLLTNYTNDEKRIQCKYF